MAKRRPAEIAASLSPEDARTMLRFRGGGKTQDFTTEHDGFNPPTAPLVKMGLLERCAYDGNFNQVCLTPMGLRVAAELGDKYARLALENPKKTRKKAAKKKAKKKMAKRKSKSKKATRRKNYAVTPTQLVPIIKKWAKAEECDGDLVVMTGKKWSRDVAPTDADVMVCCRSKLLRAIRKQGDVMEDFSELIGEHGYSYIIKGDEIRVHGLGINPGKKASKKRAGNPRVHNHWLRTPLAKRRVTGDELVRRKANLYKELRTILTGTVAQVRGIGYPAHNKADAENTRQSLIRRIKNEAAGYLYGERHNWDREKMIQLFLRGPSGFLGREVFEQSYDDGSMKWMSEVYYKVGVDTGAIDSEGRVLVTSGARLRPRNPSKTAKRKGNAKKKTKKKASNPKRDTPCVQVGDEINGWRVYDTWSPYPNEPVIMMSPTPTVLAKISTKVRWTKENVPILKVDLAHWSGRAWTLYPTRTGQSIDHREGGTPAGKPTPPRSVIAFVKNVTKTATGIVSGRQKAWAGTYKPPSGNPKKRKAKKKASKKKAGKAIAEGFGAPDESHGILESIHEFKTETKRQRKALAERARKERLAAKRKGNPRKGAVIDGWFVQSWAGDFVTLMNTTARYWLTVVPMMGMTETTQGTAYLQPASDLILKPDRSYLDGIKKSVRGNLQAQVKEAIAWSKKRIEGLPDGSRYKAWLTLGQAKEFSPSERETWIAHKRELKRDLERRLRAGVGVGGYPIKKKKANPKKKASKKKASKKNPTFARGTAQDWKVPGGKKVAGQPHAISHLGAYTVELYNCRKTPLRCPKDVRPAPWMAKVYKGRRLARAIGDQGYIGGATMKDAQRNVLREIQV